ncbi:hypothetical protein ACFHWS_19680 [Micromonospora sp. LOL_013]|uniref:hypothetical protein n=1 Tax=Micromonospora sp. LOL_013 TaxID=3345414 RepID=UPI003A8724E1
MSGTLGDVVARLYAARERLLAAAVIANRAQADAEQAAAHYSEAARGSTDQSIKTAIAEAQIAGAKADRVAGILNDICDHIVNYVNQIAPGVAPPSDPKIDVSGERLVAEAEGAGSRADRFARRFVQKADSTEEHLQNAEKTMQTGKEILDLFKIQPGSESATTVAPEPIPADRPSVDNPVTAVIMAAGATAVVGREMWKKYKKRHEGK